MVGRDCPSKVDKIEGTIYFYAPELCNDENLNNDCHKYDAYPLDIWALGITLYCLIYLEVPFKSTKMNCSEYLDLISKGIKDLPKSRDVSSDLKEFIKELLNIDPNKRPTYIDLLENKWLNHNREKLKLKTGEIIKVSEEEIEQSLDFFLSAAKNRNYELIWKPRTLLNPSIKFSNKSINKILKSTKSIKEISNVDSNKSINKVDSNYFNNAPVKIINKRVSEDDFFDN